MMLITAVTLGWLVLERDGQAADFGHHVKRREKAGSTRAAS